MTMAEATLSTESAAAGDGIELRSRRVYILPTRAGGLLTMALATMLLGCINYNNSLGYLLTFWLGSLALVSIFHTWRNLRGLSVVAGRARPVDCGEVAAFEVALVNPSDHARHALLVRHVADQRVADDDQDELAVVVTAVGAHDRTRLALPVRTRRRGWLRLGPVVIATRYPLGLFRAWSVLDTEQAVVVYPRPEGSVHLPQGNGGSTSDGPAGGPGNDDYAGLRNYQRGDSMRLIHWKAAARSEALPVKEFSGTTSDVLQFDPDTLPGDTEARISQVALWLREAELAGCRYGLTLGATVVAPASGERHLHACLTHLALHGSPAR